MSRVFLLTPEVQENPEADILICFTPDDETPLDEVYELEYFSVRDKACTGPDAEELAAMLAEEEGCPFIKQWNEEEG